MPEPSDAKKNGLVEEPPEEVSETAAQIPEQELYDHLRHHGHFPPKFVSLKDNPAEERTHHFLWVLRYRIAYPTSGLWAMVGLQSKRKDACKWAAWETDTTYSQINKEVATVYSAAENPQKQFGEDLDSFTDSFK